MAFKMPQPFKRKSGVYHLNARVPVDLMTRIPGTTITLPLDGLSVTVRASDKVMVSLRTKDLTVAVARCAAAYAALLKYWRAVREGPKPLSFKQIVALAGEAYQGLTKADDDFDPAPWERQTREIALRDEESLNEWRSDTEDGPGLGEEGARFYAAVQRPRGPQLLAFETEADVVSPFINVTYDEAVTDLFGSEADRLFAQHGIVSDQASRLALVRQIAKAARLAGPRLADMVDGDFSPDANLAQYPVFDGDFISNRPPTCYPVKGNKVTLEVLFERWKVFNKDKRARSTVFRYAPSVARLSTFLGARDVRSVVKADIEKWADQLRDVDQIAPATVNRNELVAARSLFTFATSRESDKDSNGEKQPLRFDNPATGVKLAEPRREGQKAEKRFRLQEIADILRLARSANERPRYPKASASRRFAPFVCGYSGARIQEVCSLRKEDIWCEGSIFVMRFTQTKNGLARTVPIHDAIIEEGLLDYWEAAPSGLLFAGDRAVKADARHSQGGQRASELAVWISENVDIKSGAAPNHGWRHTFISIAQSARVRMSREMACAIAGHNQRRDAHSEYESFSIEDMKSELDRFPKYHF